MAETAVFTAAAALCHTDTDGRTAAAAVARRVDSFTAAEEALADVTATEDITAEAEAVFYGACTEDLLLHSRRVLGGIR